MPLRIKVVGNHNWGEFCCALVLLAHSLATVRTGGALVLIQQGSSDVKHCAPFAIACRQGQIYYETNKA